MKFDSAELGTWARLRDIEFTTIRGRKWVCDLRVISAADDQAIIQRASEYVRANGGEAVDGKPLFEFRCAVEKLAVSATDPDSPLEKPEPFFPDGAKDVGAALDRDSIIYLVARLDEFQSRTSPLKRSLSREEFRDATNKAAIWEEGEPDPFVHWAPSLRLSFMHGLAAQFASSQLFKLLDSSASLPPAPTANPTDGPSPSSGD